MGAERTLGNCSFSAVLVREGLHKTFYGRLRPISDKWVPDALAVSGFTREETLAFDDPKTVMENFAGWLKESFKGRPFFVSDNNGFDWQFVSWYFWHFTGANPFGHSSTNLGSLYKGLVRDTFQNFKHLRKTPHTHHPVDDAKGNAEALLETRVRPAVAADGGDITFRGYKDGIVYLAMQGSCAGCPSSTATLKHGIENLLRHFVPEVSEVRAV